MNKYNLSYYENVYAGFEHPDFARKWAVGCRIAADVPEKVSGKILEFGAGLGQNLAVIDASEKWAVDINSASKDRCEAQGFKWVDSLDAVPEDYFDVIISRHSLEHVHSPNEVLSQLCRKIVTGGRFILVVPYEDMDIPRDIGNLDAHAHLYAWSPMTIKNLLIETGWHLKSLKIHNGMLFKRSLFFLSFGSNIFSFIRKAASKCLPLKSAEIVVVCEKVR